MTLPTSLCDLFAQAASRCPDNLAVDHTEGSLTYRQLDDVSNSLANMLMGLGVNQLSPVILLTSHGTFNIIATLAILKVGSCCVPIDRATWPQERINYVCQTVANSVILNTTSEPFMPSEGAGDVLNYTSMQSGPSFRPNPVFQAHKVAADDTAYIIFTSGSTGKPKGVLISHKSLCLYSTTSPINLDIGPGDRLLHILSVAFDACACMLFSALGNCGTIVPAQAEDVLLQAPSCTVLAATPAMLKNLPSPTTENSIFSNLSRVILGGETASPDLLGLWIDAGVQVLIAYGVTETTSMGSIYRVERDPRTDAINPYIIGGVLEQSPIWIVDSELRIIKNENSEGEIIVGGDGVAQGYYNDEQKTRSNFIHWNGSRIYRTGDFGCWVLDANGRRVIEFRGRKDRTVKNQGYLVNLDRDVEAALYRVGESFGLTSVRAVATGNGIVAVVTPSNVNTSALIEKAKDIMCSYCIPYRIGAVDDLPLSPNGKVQHNELAELIKIIDEGQHNQENKADSQLSEKIERGKFGDDRHLDTLLTVARDVLSLPGQSFRILQPHDSFFAVGGSSLLAFKLVSVLGQHGLNIPARELFKNQPFSDVAPLITSRAHSSTWRLTEHDDKTQQTLAELQNQACQMLGLVQNSFEIGPLTSLQLDLALPTLGDESRNINQVKIAYNAPHSGIMRRAWQGLWQSEPVFRTEVSLAVGCGALIVHNKPFRKYRVVSHSCRDKYEEAVKGINMGVGLGCTLDVLTYHKTSDGLPYLPVSSNHNSSSSETDELTVVLTIHHSLMDGESLKLLLDKVDRIALGFSQPLSGSSINANLALIKTQNSRDSEVRSFFSDYLRHLSPENIAPGQVSATENLEGSSSRETAFFETSVSSVEVSDFAKLNCSSAACIYYIAWAMAVAAFDNSPDVLIGAVVSNRPALQHHEHAIGAYMSTLPLVFNFRDDEETVVDRIQKTMEDLATVGEYAWARSDQCGIGRRMRTLLSMQFPLPNESSKPPALWTESAENSDFPLCLLVESSGDFRMLYDATQFNWEAAQRLGQHFKHALYSLHHETRVTDCMTVNRLQENLAKQSEIFRLKPSERIVKQVLEQVMGQFPSLIAVEDCLGGKLTYSELDKLTNVIAHHINSTVPNAEVIALYSDGTIQWILGLLGTVKAGCTYVNLDPRSSVSRRETICKQCGAEALLLPNASQASEAPLMDNLKVLAVDEMLSGNSKKHNGKQPDRASLDSSLVIVFTSGTTGNPKGILISNRSFLSMETSYGTTMFAAPGRRIAQFMSPVFDVCNMEIFSALLHGATLVLRDPSDPYANLHRVNTAAVTPSAMAVIDLDDFPNLQLIYACGEPVTKSLVKRYTKRALLYNAYGPAECSILTSIERLIPGDQVTVGRPLSTVRVYILDEDQHPMAPGDRGEVCVAGVQVLRDYINAPEQAARNILTDPWYPGERMYRSGDSGSIGRDGRLSLHGRIDRLVKLRGFRVELAGVEHAVVSGPTEEGVSQCAAIAVNGLLIVYVSFERSQQHDSLSNKERIAQLLSRLREQLLPSSVPQEIVHIDNFPRTINGKIDTRALETQYSSYKNTSIEKAVGDCPITRPKIEDKLAHEWRQVLQLIPETQLQESDDFFKLGGHSVSIMLLATRLTAAFGKKITVRELLPSPTFKDQINMVRALLEIETFHKEEPQMLPPLLTEELTSIEKQVWFQHQVATTVTAFNIIRVIQIEGAVEIDKLCQSLNNILSIDPIFRSNIVEGPKGPARILRNSAPTVQEVDEFDIERALHHRFNLAHDYLIQVYLARHGCKGDNNDHATLVILTSHVIADLGTLQNFLQLTSTAYSGSTLVPLDRPKHLDSKSWTRIPTFSERKFWSEYLKGLIRRLGLTHHQLALAVGALFLQWFSAEDDLVLGAPNSGRPTSQEQESLGQFLDRLPIRITPNDLGNDDTMTKLTEILNRVRHSSLKALSNAISFSNIIQDLGYPSGGLEHPLFECDCFYTVS
uniref:Nonribosomal peptide synthetase verP n=1 Tax=Clonostachys rogersoniana TaxID=122658 RepID=VERP_CLORO|nr:RecName: Full=Nonribosomal peptide synthetase verP; Short=NRPS verP; AltName: Full=Verticillin biosynthesis cluster protein P [Clonostachys rogersoniana]AQZ42163.1 putative nonribosomal peptide synthase [Gliocladium sp.]